MPGGQPAQGGGPAAHRAGEVGGPLLGTQPRLVHDSWSGVQQSPGCHVLPRRAQQRGRACGQGVGRVVATLPHARATGRTGTSSTGARAPTAAAAPCQEGAERVAQGEQPVLLVGHDHGPHDAVVRRDRPRRHQARWRRRRRAGAGGGRPASQARQSTRPGRSQPTHRPPSSRSVRASVRVRAGCRARPDRSRGGAARRPRSVWRTPRQPTYVSVTRGSRVASPRSEFERSIRLRRVTA